MFLYSYVRHFRLRRTSQWASAIVSHCRFWIQYPKAARRNEIPHRTFYVLWGIGGSYWLLVRADDVARGSADEPRRNELEVVLQNDEDRVFLLVDAIHPRNCRREFFLVVLQREDSEFPRLSRVVAIHRAREVFTRDTEVRESEARIIELAREARNDDFGVNAVLQGVERRPGVCGDGIAARDCRLHAERRTDAERVGVRGGLLRADGGFSFRGVRMESDDDGENEREEQDDRQGRRFHCTTSREEDTAE